MLLWIYCSFKLTTNLAASRAPPSIKYLLGLLMHHIIKTKNTYHVSASPHVRWGDVPCLVGQYLHMPSECVSVSVVTVTQFTADPVLKLKPLVSFLSDRHSHGSSIIMGLACNPVTSPKKQTERATSTHSETLSYYCNPQRGIIWTHCILMRQLRSDVTPPSYCCDWLVNENLIKANFCLV